MTCISENLFQLNQQITDAASRYHRDPNALTLLAVSKTQPVESLREAIEAGQRHFGENYIQEASQKIGALAHEDLVWHFIGPIQSNKTKYIAEAFQWVHSVDRIKIVERLQAQRSSHLPPLNVCIEVNIDNEETKSGVRASEIIPLAQKIVSSSNLKLRGLMVIPKASETFEEQCQPFRAVKVLVDRLNQLGFGLDTLSMGMTHDFEAAIKEGATILRIGTAIFGSRMNSPARDCAN